MFLEDCLTSDSVCFHVFFLNYCAFLRIQHTKVDTVGVADIKLFIQLIHNHRGEPDSD